MTAPDKMWRETISPNQMYKEGGSFYHETKPEREGLVEYTRSDLITARAVAWPAVVARGVVRDTTDPTGRTMYVLFDRAMSDDEMRDWHDQINALHPASPLGAVATDSFDQLIAESKAEAIRAMIKFPQPNYVISKVAEEAGEVVKAAIHCAEGRETPENVIGEMRQTIAMLYRLWVEGDQVHGLAALAPFARKGE